MKVKKMKMKVKMKKKERKTERLREETKRNDWIKYLKQNYGRNEQTSIFVARYLISLPSFKSPTMQFVRELQADFA